MSRKESVTVENILESAFAIAREDGISQVTARHVATKNNCSTQPIFSAFRNMDELWDAVYFKANEFFQDFYEFYPRMSKLPFVNLGMAYLAFAKSEEKLFRLLFLSDIKKLSMYELLDGKNENVGYEIECAQKAGCEDAEGLFTEMWMFIHGAACMALTGDYHLSDVQMMALLERTYNAFVEKM